MGGAWARIDLKQRGSGWAANRLACSASDRKPEVDGWYGPYLVHHYIQYIVRELGGRDAVQLARDWTRTLRDAIRSQDRSHLITIGLLPFRDCAFDPRNVADLVDLVTMHEYPAAGEGGRALALIRYFASHGRPLLLGETFAFDRPTQETFLLAARRWLDGSLSFYDGRAPEEVITTNPADAAYRQNLISYLGLRTSLQASPRWPSPAVATPRDDEPRGLPHRSR